MGQADIRGLDLAMLRTFDALLRERSVSRAAARLFLSQPAVSASLKRLREMFDDPLFTRTAHGVVPTPRALALAPRVEAVLHEMQQLMNQDRVFDPATSDRILRIAGSDHACHVVLPVLCRELAARNSRMRLSWESGDYSRMGELLRKGDIDLGLVPRMTPITGVESSILYEGAYVVVARHGHPILTAGMSLDGFCDAPHVVLSQSRSMLDDTVDQMLGRQGLSRHVLAAVMSFSQMVDLISDSDVIAVFPQPVAQRYRDRLASMPAPVALPHYRLYVCWDSRATTDDAVMWLKDEILRTGPTFPRGSAA